MTDTSEATIKTCLNKTTPHYWCAYNKDVHGKVAPNGPGKCCVSGTPCYRDEINVLCSIFTPSNELDCYNIPACPGDDGDDMCYKKNKNVKGGCNRYMKEVSSVFSNLKKYDNQK